MPHISQVDYIIEGSNIHFLSFPTAEPSEMDDNGQTYLEEIEDRSCLQLGIGTLPDLLNYLRF